MDERDTDGEEEEREFMLLQRKRNKEEEGLFVCVSWLDLD